MDFVDDILQSMSVDQMVEYRARCAQQLPHALRGHHFLLLQERWIRYLAQTVNQAVATEISDRCKFKFYIHRRGQVDNCTFVAITETATHHDEYAVFFFTLEPNCAELSECVRQTQRINWLFSPLITSIHSDQIAAVNSLIEENQFDLDMQYSDENVCVWLPREEAVKFKYEIPDDVYAAPLNGTHVNTINSVWPHRSPCSDKFIGTLLRLNEISIGLFDRKTHQLLAWVFTNYRFAISNLQVVEAAKRRGLGRILVKMYCKAFVKQENLDPIAYIVEENHISRKLFDSLGFQVYRRSYWLKLKTSH